MAAVDCLSDGQRQQRAQPDGAPDELRDLHEQLLLAAGMLPAQKR